MTLKEAQEALKRLNGELGLELAQTAADLAGLADPTPISDGIGAAISIARGDYVGAGLSLISMVPYVGDAAGKPIKAARNGKRILKLRKEIAELIQIIDKLSPGARRASGKTGDAVTQQMKRALEPTLQNPVKKPINVLGKIAPAKVPINDSNKLNHIFGQTKHNWNLTGLDQHGNITLMENIVKNPRSLVNTKQIPTGKVETYQEVYNGLTIEIKVFENTNGVRVISDGWVK